MRHSLLVALACGFALLGVRCGSEETAGGKGAGAASSGAGASGGGGSTASSTGGAGHGAAGATGSGGTSGAGGTGSGADGGTAGAGTGGSGGGPSCGGDGDACMTTFDCCAGNTCKQGTCNDSAACIDAGGFCTFANADDCCSGACDGDSCCGFYGDACQNGFGCCLGQCISGICQCGPPDKICNGACTSVTWDDANCGDCGVTCGFNQTCYSGACECVDTFDTVNCADGCFYLSQFASDPNHCGDCTTVCGAGLICDGGVCVVCAAGLTECGAGNCVDTDTDPANCGACGAPCDAAHDCVGGQCVCKPGTTLCNAVCVNTMTDKNNCGQCGLVCNGMKMCVGGSCS